MKKQICILVFLTVGVVLSAQYQNSANKYLEIHKQYDYAKSPIPKDNIKHFVYFSRDREAIKNHPFLKNDRFIGAQIMYGWNQLEGKKGEYDFSIILEDYRYLKSKGKKLFIQLQDATFYNENKGVPKYLLSSEYDGGILEQRDDKGNHEGWVAKRWNKNVQIRFKLLISALGSEFDGKVEGINLQETAIGVSHEYDPTFTPEKYVSALKEIMLHLKHTFPKSVKMLYANFMPGEWLPWDNFGYLQSIYDYGEEIGVGLGTPDLMFKRKGQLNHPIAMMHESSYTVPLGIGIQDGNYIGKTGTLEKLKERINIVPKLHAFAKDFLKVDYMFWVNQEPYFVEDVLPCFK